MHISLKLHVLTLTRVRNFDRIESIQPGLINWGRLQFEFDSAHVKYGI